MFFFGELHPSEYGLVRVSLVFRADLLMVASELYPPVDEITGLLCLGSSSRGFRSKVLSHVLGPILAISKSHIAWKDGIIGIQTSVSNESPFHLTTGGSQVEILATHQDAATRKPIQFRFLA